MTRPSARYVLPEFTERTGSGQRTMDPYSKLLEERIVFLGTPVDETSANDVMAQFMYLEHHAPDRDISLYINSPGGTFHAMTALYDTMQYINCDVETVCLGQAGAAASMLLAAGTPGKRSVLPDARLVIHQPALPEPVHGQASDLAIQADELMRIRTRMEEMLARHTGRTREQVSADIERDKILTAQEAVEYGLVDRIVPNRKATLAPPTGE
ncbi:ATP-dependent Clp protease, proteolytic subunit ClpP [Streptomyces viridochromogenes DSM 40736]|uniref:ATP-dependent Clp protease proteolytic subunit n=1 Tax=Streptomyces viridochromogenes (strain DSM 40736 / JCM 4977 / BCRC 1201 / Tue 494) TaxID=591159 RepID=D9XGH7_STRVT|nr:ATP-dependent Clp protease proteolytic subunit [Streptomyces viridochromogenes]EFL30598.1 ATP-dependent Clp protease, proteolytic subunit ClpP [Streptomyces viridochromogenes DSM 40736]